MQENKTAQIICWVVIVCATLYFGAQVIRGLLIEHNKQKLLDELIQEFKKKGGSDGLYNGLNNNAPHDNIAGGYYGNSD